MNELHKIAFDYRNAVLPEDAHDAWQELEQYVKQLINDEREACEKAVSNVLYGQDGCGKAIEAIGARKAAMTYKEENKINQYIKPGAIVPVDMQTTTILVEALRAALAQPQREWVGLTDEDVDNLGSFGSRAEFVRAIEAKVKDKNA